MWESTGAVRGLRRRRGGRHDRGAVRGGAHGRGLGRARAPARRVRATVGFAGGDRAALGPAGRGLDRGGPSGHADPPQRDQGVQPQVIARPAAPQGSERDDASAIRAAGISSLGHGSPGLNRPTVTTRPDRRGRLGAATTAPADPRPGALAEAGRDRLLRLPRRADERSRPGGTSSTCGGVRYAAVDRGRPSFTWERDRRGWPMTGSQAQNPSPQPAAAALRRQALEMGAVCGKSARTVLCGGRPVMGVPTAIPAVSCAPVPVRS